MKTDFYYLPLKNGKFSILKHLDDVQSPIKE